MKQRTFNSLLALALTMLVLVSSCNLFKKPDTQEGIFGWGGTQEDFPTASITKAASVVVAGGAKGLATPRVVAIPEVALIESPEVEGHKVAATHVSFYNNLGTGSMNAYIGYNTRYLEAGTANYHGALQVIDIADAGNPKILQTLSLPMMDVAATQVVTSAKVTYLYVAGRMSPEAVQKIFGFESLDKVPSTAVLERFVIKEDGTFDPEASTAKAVLLPGYYVTSVFHSTGTGGEYIFVTTGNDIADESSLAKVDQFRKGGTYALNKSTFKVLDMDLYNYAMYLDIENANNHHISLQGADDGQGVLHIYKVGKYDASAHKMISVGGIDVVRDNGDGTKNTVDLYRNADGSVEIGFVAMGKAGMKAFDILDGSLKVGATPQEAKPVFQVTKLEPEDEDLFCTSVAADATTVYMAMGSGGLWVATLDTSAAEAPELEPTKYSLDDLKLSGGNANFVAVSEDLVFLAGGEAGTAIRAK